MKKITGKAEKNDKSWELGLNRYFMVGLFDKNGLLGLMQKMGKSNKI